MSDDPMPGEIWACIDQSTEQGWWEIKKTHFTDTRYIRADLVPAWRPIETAETAPMNPGDSIIVWDGMQAREAVLLIGQNARGTVRAWVTTDGERICGITKWMPFPAGPTPPGA